MMDIAGPTYARHEKKSFYFTHLYILRLRWSSVSTFLERRGVGVVPAENMTSFPLFPPLLTFNSLTLVILLPWYYLIVAVLVPLPPKPARWQHRAIPQSTGLWFLPDPCLVLSLINFRSSGCLSTCSQGVSSTLSRQSSSLPFDVC